jgi:Spy/CpxP family protein refolding chaperone
MKKFRIRTTGVILFAMITATSINAQPIEIKEFKPPMHERPCFNEDQGMMQHDFLDLTDEQKEKMNALRLEQYTAMKPFRNQLAELKAREHTLLSEDQVDMEALYKVIDNRTELLNKMQKLQVQYKVAVKAILTQEQLMKLDQRGNFAAHHGRNCTFQ